MSRNAEADWGPFGNPGSQRARVYEIANVERIEAGGVAVRVRREATPLFALLLEAADTGLWGRHKPYPLRQQDTGGYNSRWITGSTSVLSNHAGGLAVDVNWLTNGYGSSKHDIPDWLYDYARDVLGMRVGIDYDTPDPMHFEIVETPEQVAARVARLANREQEFTVDKEAAEKFDAIMAALADLKTRVNGLGTTVRQVKAAVDAHDKHLAEHDKGGK